MSLHRVAPLLVTISLLYGCSDPLQDQPGYMPHERPLLSVPAGAVPAKLDRHAHQLPEPARSLEESKSLTNPIPRNGSNIKRGQVAFERYCSHCHGDLGRGWTSVGSSFDPAPPNLVEATEGVSDGEIFGTLTFGRGLSPALGPTIAPEDRWRIILFLRTLEERRAEVDPDWGQ